MQRIRNIFILLMIVLAAAPAAQISPAPAAAAEAITLTTPPNGWEPFINAPDRQSGHGGILVDVFRAIVEQLGYDCRLVSNPEKQGLMMVRQGRVDAAPKAEEWVSGPDRYLWTDPIVTSTDTVVSRTTTPVAYAVPDDLKGRTVGVVTGFKYPSLTPLIDSGAVRAVRATTVEELLILLMQGRIDCAVANGPVAKWVIKRRGDINPENVVFSRKPLDTAPLRFAFTGGDKWKPFIKRFNAELAAMRQDGRMAAILNHYQ